MSEKEIILKQYREILNTIQGDLNMGFEPNEFALNALKAARNALQLTGRCEKPTRKRKHEKGEAAKIKGTKMNAIVAIWTKELQPYLVEKQVEKLAFENAFTMHGLKGYESFVNAIKRVVSGSIAQEEDATPKEKSTWIADFEKPGGWIQNITQNLVQMVWDPLVQRSSKEPQCQILGNPGFFERKKTLLAEWSKGLLLAKAESGTSYKNKVVKVGPVTIEAKHIGRPSRSVANTRSLHFLKPDQVNVLQKIGKGVQGDVVTCHILECPLIAKEAYCVAKRFKDGDKHKRRADALQEVLMGGLNHKGIVGALAMTIEDPPRLVYDHYNGGDLIGFIDMCDDWRRGKGKFKSKGKDHPVEVDHNFIIEKKLFLENRLGIAMAILDTMHFLHEQNRVHCDLHFGNFLLHFDYEDGSPTKVYVGICDFGMSKALSQCRVKENQMWPISNDRVDAYRNQYPQLAPELVSPTPAPYSKATDVYSVGNLFQTLLQAKDNWDDMGFSKFLQVGWNAQFHRKALDDMVASMMNTDPAKRMHFGHWKHHMNLVFPDCRLSQIFHRYLRD